MQNMTLAYRSLRCVYSRFSIMFNRSLRVFANLLSNDSQIKTFRTYLTLLGEIRTLVPCSIR
jgi:hypothetical protein